MRFCVLHQNDPVFSTRFALVPGFWHINVLELDRVLALSSTQGWHDLPTLLFLAWSPVVRKFAGAHSLYLLVTSLWPAAHTDIPG